MALKGRVSNSNKKKAKITSTNSAGPQQVSVEVPAASGTITSVSQLNALNDVTVNQTPAGGILQIQTAGGNFVSTAIIDSDSFAGATSTSIHSGESIKAYIDAQNTSGTITFTDKTIDLDSNTITGTLAEFNTALQDGSFASLAGSETLSNKTITTPTIETINQASGDFLVDASGDVILDAGGADIIFKDDGTEFGRLTNNSGELQIKSGSGATTNLTMSGANTTIAGNLTVTGNATANGSTITLGDSASDTVSFGGTITGNLVFEGSTDDSFETTLAPGNPSADITLTLPSSGSDTLVGKATTDTLTNKTLTSPALTTPAITGNTTTTGDVIFEGSTSDSFETTLTVVDPTADRTVSLPNATDTLVGKDTTDTLTNKTLTNPVITNITGSSITLDSAGDVNLDADGADVILKDGGTEYGRFTNNSGELQIKSGSSSTTNMTMSGANTTVAGNLTVTGTTTFNGGTITLGDAATDTVAFNGTISTNLIFEGSSADSFETTLAPGNPTADITLTLPTSTGTIATTTDVFFDNSTTTTHPAADGNADLAGGESPFESITDAFGVITGTSYDMMNPKGSNVTIDLGSVA